MGRCVPQSLQVRVDMLVTTWRYFQKVVFPSQLEGWTLKLCGRCSKTAGICKFDKKQVVVAMCFVENNHNPTKQLRDTLLHEIAHALAGPHAGHGPVWQGVAKSIGCSAERYHSMLSLKQMKAC